MSTGLGNPAGVRQALLDSSFDAVVALSPENVPYLAGSIIETQKGLRDRLAIVLWPKGGEPSFLVCTIEEPQAREESWIKDIRGYVEFKTSPAVLLGEVIREKGLGQSRIGIELGYLSARYFAELQSEVPAATFVPAEPFFGAARAIKTPEEIAALQEAGVATERALLATYTTIRLGEAERSMRSRVMQNLLLCGADGFEFVYINAGGNSGFPHKIAGGYQCRAGDTVKSDVGGSWGGYVSDMGRTGTVGKPNQHQADIWAKLWQVQRATIDMLRPGSTPAQVFDTMKRKMAEVDLPFPLPHAGHSIGRTVHESPVLNPMDHSEIRPNMTFMVESRVRWPNQEGYHLEDLILVTEVGPRWLTGDTFSGERLFSI
jgi:Xaa-Pro aminopeptidase